MNLKKEGKKTWTPPKRSAQAQVLNFFRENYSGGVVEQCFNVTINFHPDRKNENDIPILESLKNDGMLKSQFETRTSNGGLSAYPGGERWFWEHQAFGGNYDHVAASERPKYGALNHRCSGSGGSPRFGSAHIRLKPDIVERATFCYPDSYYGPMEFGAQNRISHLIVAADSDVRDPLDNYIEAHIHGPIFLASDVEAIVLDPAFKGTEIERLARDLPCDIEWHRGFRLHVRVVEEHPEFRGHRYLRIAGEIARDGFLDPLILGEAIDYDPQDVKKVWHYLARFGDLNRTAGQTP